MPQRRVEPIAELLSNVTLVPDSPLSDTLQRTLWLARHLLQQAQALQTPQERKQQMELDRMIQHPHDKATLTQLTDQAFRSHAAARAVDQLVHILDVQGIPRFFSPIDRTLLQGFHSFGGHLPGVAVPLVKEKMRRETANVVLPAESEYLIPHLKDRRQEGVRMNVNFLGEAILSEPEAQRRLEQYLRALQLAEIEVVSVKISTIFSQISTLDRRGTIDTLSDRLELLYRAARQGTFRRADGSAVPKFVYLDMEEYRDMSLTAEAFMQTLDRPGLDDVSAGIALQAYLPDAHRVQQQLTEWAQRRTASGGQPITIRIVKGANLEMERVEAALNDWPQAPYSSKVETDANYKRMVAYALQPQHLAAVRAGIASHNLFDIAYALTVAWELGSLGAIQFEMLEGMANHQRRALHQLTRNVLLYAPTCRKSDFLHAIAYLIRRLDENTGPENFLRHAFRITADSDAWRQLEAGFLRSFDAIPTLDSEPRRTQDRRHEVWPEPTAPLTLAEFVNEPNTDFGLPHHSEWAESLLKRWHALHGERASDVPLVIAGHEVTETREIETRHDPSRPGVIVSRHRLANHDDVQRAVECARHDPGGWRSLSVHDRRMVLRRAARELRIARADLMGAATSVGGKLLTESDPEVSEAVDFAEFYAAATGEIARLSGVDAAGRGVVVVVSPWNFPIAIPCGGVAAALAAGNTVILKPASHTVLVAHLLCECFYRAGVPRTALQLLPCRGSTVGQELVTHPMVDTVVLTGGTATARQMLQARTDLRLLAETGGKNATIVTALSDRDQAIKHVLHSAFSHSGQKCSATSLLLLEQEVYDDAAFRQTLVEATASLPVGSAWDLQTRIGPLITGPSGDLEQGLKVLEDGESWALMPEPHPENHQLYSPGIKWDVEPGSYTHSTEFFGPLLAVLPFRYLGEAVDMVNQTGYGLTSGLESLDDREQTEWTAGIRAGNLYVNRPTTGAIVLRQPFGGQGLSSVGPGIKAGGPNYVVPLMAYRPTGHPTGDGRVLDPDLVELWHGLAEPWGGRAVYCPITSEPQPGEHLVISQPERQLLQQAIASYDFQARQEFLVQHDDLKLLGQDNFRRYLPVDNLCIRLSRHDSWFDIFARAAAARAVGCRTIVSTPPGVGSAPLAVLHELTDPWGAKIEFVEQSDDELIRRISEGELGRIRYAAPDRVPLRVRAAANEQLLYIADEPVLAEGRIELLWYVTEQSISVNYHRYGNLGQRASEQRRTGPVAIQS